MSQRSGRSQEIHHRYTTIYILTAALFVVVAVIIALVFVRFNELPSPAPTPDQGSSAPPASSGAPATEEPSPSLSTSTEASSPSAPLPATDYLEYSAEKLKEHNILSIISPDNPFDPITVSGTTVRITSANRNTMALAYEVDVAPELYAALTALQADLNEKFKDDSDSGKHQLRLIAGYFSTNAGLISCPADKNCADISHCDHANGYSIDFNFNNGGRGFIYSQEQAKYLREVCAKYGLITPDIVGDTTAALGNSVWHLRYVGAPYAEYLMENELSLADFFENAKGYNYNKRLTITADQDGNTQSYQLYYVAAGADGAARIPVPTGAKYTVLSNGTDGYLVILPLTTPNE